MASPKIGDLMIQAVNDMNSNLNIKVKGSLKIGLCSKFDYSLDEMHDVVCKRFVRIELD